MQITVTGVESVLKRLEKYTDMDKKLAELARRLCAVGEPIIKQIHGNHATVKSEPTSRGYRIVASGTDVLFI